MDFFLLHFKLNPLLLFERYNFLCCASSKLILLYHTKQLTGGGHEEICDKKVGHATKMVGNHWSRVGRF